MAIWHLVFDGVSDGAVGIGLEVGGAAARVMQGRGADGRAAPRQRLVTIDGEPVRTAAGRSLAVDGALGPRALKRGDVLVLLKTLGDKTVAIVPQGPEHAPDQEEYGTFIENFSLALARHLEPDVAFIRYDLPWASPFASELREGRLTAFPEARVREMRMNMGTQHWNIRKSFEDLTVASSLVVDIGKSEYAILEGMKPKTRYNIGLAQRKGVTVATSSEGDGGSRAAHNDKAPRVRGFSLATLKTLQISE